MCHTQAAINKAMPRGTQQLPSEMAPDIEMLEEIKTTPRSSSSSKLQMAQSSKTTVIADAVESAKPGTSRPKSCMRNRTLTFHINYLDNVYKINLSELSTLSKCGDWLELLYYQPYFEIDIWR